MQYNACDVYFSHNVAWRTKAVGDVLASRGRSAADGWFTCKDCPATWPSNTTCYRMQHRPTIHAQGHIPKVTYTAQVTTMLATSKNVLFPGHNHLY